MLIPVSTLIRQYHQSLHKLRTAEESKQNLFGKVSLKMSRKLLEDVDIARTQHNKVSELVKQALVKTILDWDPETLAQAIFRLDAKLFCQTVKWNKDFETNADRLYDFQSFLTNIFSDELLRNVGEEQVTIKTKNKKLESSDSIIGRKVEVLIRTAYLLVYHCGDLTGAGALLNSLTLLRLDSFLKNGQSHMSKKSFDFLNQLECLDFRSFDKQEILLRDLIQEFQHSVRIPVIPYLPAFQQELSKIRKNFCIHNCPDNTNMQILSDIGCEAVKNMDSLIGACQGLNSLPHISSPNDKSRIRLKAYDQPLKNSSASFCDESNTILICEHWILTRSPS